ncbi:hypothetical protein F5146DRAFT_1007523 [Armillaria mellea]|nr:hypothetical protein F5146DRAFT_1007523 [Armillaria mellea]
MAERCCKGRNCGLQLAIILVPVTARANAIIASPAAHVLKSPCKDPALSEKYGFENDIITTSSDKYEGGDKAMADVWWATDLLVLTGFLRVLTSLRTLATHWLEGFTEMNPMGGCSGAIGTVPSYRDAPCLIGVEISTGVAARGKSRITFTAIWPGCCSPVVRRLYGHGT